MTISGYVCQKLTASWLHITPFQTRIQTITTNWLCKMSLKQALDMLKDGRVFVMHTTQAMRGFCQDLDTLDLDTQTVAYFDINFMPGLLDEGEWEYYITQKGGNVEIKDTNVRKRLAAQKAIPNKEYYRCLY